MMNNKILEDGLKANGFDGFVLDSICGCVIGNLSPEGCFNSDCRPGYQKTHSQDSTRWVVHESPGPIADDEIDEIIKECC